MALGRRTFVKSLAASSLLALGGRCPAQQKSTIAVIGAGAFGGWTALSLLRAGAKVTLIDAWGPGHSRSSSGGESRVIRHAYSNPLYIEMSKRSLALWREASDTWNRPLLHVSGVLHMWREDSSLSMDAEGMLMEEAGVPIERFSHSELVSRYPQVNMDGVGFAVYEPTAGYILARRACQAVVDAFLAEGGEYKTAHAKPGTIASARMSGIELSTNEVLAADQYVFACGPWLKTLFPEVLDGLMSISRQEMFYFGTPANDRRYDAGHFPVWTDIGDEVWYGIPGGEHRGFKVADDAAGPPHDPSTTMRTVSDKGIRSASNYIAYRFPGLKDAPLVESRVCQYTNTPDGDFVADRHPEADNVWLVGGGSGHGFKHGPALGEMMAAQVLGESPIEPTFSLGRFAS